MSVIAVLKDFKSVCDTCGVPEEAAMWSSKQYLTILAELAVTSPASPLRSVNIGHDWALQMFSEYIQSLLKQYETNDKIDNLDNGVRALKQRSLTSTVFAQKLWSSILTYRCIYEAKSLGVMFGNDIQAFIRKFLKNCWAVPQNVSL